LRYVETETASLGGASKGVGADTILFTRKISGKKYHRDAAEVNISNI
jgi:hypothetical protein